MTSYTTLEVQNFKGIREMKLEGLGMVNVFVGGNNVGKTSVLQAIAIAKNTEGFPDNFISHHLDNEIPFRNQVDYNLSLFGTATKISLHNFHYQKNSNCFINIKIASLLEKENEEISIIKEGTEAIIFHIQQSRFVYGMEYCAFVKNELVSVDLVPSTLYYLSVLFKKNVPDPEDTQFTNYISTDINFYEALATKFYDELERDNPIICDKIVQALKKIQPDLIRIKVTNGVTECYLASSEKWLALETMGEGFVKLLGLLVAMQFSKGKVLLIDEIENGFHWSVQKDMWRMILTAAKDDGTQFFFTTHSKEVYQTLAQMTKEITAEWEQEKAENYKDGKLLVGEDKTPMDVACLFHLDKDETDKVTAVRITGEKLYRLAERDLEVR